jgi:hypothetical protein
LPETIKKLTAKEAQLEEDIGLVKKGINSTNNAIKTIENKILKIER